MKKLLLLLLLLCATHANAAFVAEDSNIGDNLLSIATNSTLTVSAGNGCGVFVHFFEGADANTITITDNLSNTWTPRGTNVYNTTDDWGVRLYSSILTNGGSMTVTATVTGATSLDSFGIVVSCYDNIASFLDAVTARQSSPGTGTDAVSSGNLNFTSQPGRIIAMSINYTSANEPNAGTGFTSREADIFGGFGRLTDRQVVATGNAAGTFTAVSGQGTSIYYTSQIAFLESGGGGGVNLVPIIHQQQ